MPRPDRDLFFDWYRMHDAEPRGAIPIRHAEARRWNDEGFGIYWTVNEFRGARRIENLARVNAWCVDIDEGPKRDQWERLRSGLLPSMVNETKRGFQAYWFAEDGTQDNWRAIVEQRLVPHFGADTKAKDLARILRVPGFYHLKNIFEPFLVKTVRYEEAYYTEKQMLRHFPAAQHARTQATDNAAHERRAISRASGSGDLFEKIYNLDCIEALGRLSGTRWVNGETYDFKRQHGGTWNIWVDGKSTSSWIDANGRIGSTDKGGPSIWQWLRWFGRSDSEVYAIIRDAFPEIVPKTEGKRR